MLVWHSAIKPSILRINSGNLALYHIVLNQFQDIIGFKFYCDAVLPFYRIVSAVFLLIDIPIQGAPSWWWDIFINAKINAQETSAINPPSLLFVYLWIIYALFR